jgi:redox-regulated HSP33 family molecular chaperone
VQKWYIYNNIVHLFSILLSPFFAIPIELKCVGNAQMDKAAVRLTAASVLGGVHLHSKNRHIFAITITHLFAFPMMAMSLMAAQMVQWQQMIQRRGGDTTADMVVVGVFLSW